MHSVPRSCLDVREARPLPCALDRRRRPVTLGRGRARPATTAETAAAAPVPDILRQYKTVTAERLKRPEDNDWLMIRRTYDGWGYSPLSQITTGNVARLQPAWVFSTGVINGHEAPPIVNNGVMFVATPGNQVIALDAKTGGLLWRYRRPPPEDVIVLHPTTRGVAVYGDKVFLAANECVLVALDARTGAEVWTTKVEDNSKGYYMTLAPLVADGKVIVGASGGELGVRGFVVAYDPETGAQVWKTYTVPAPGEPGSETWPKGDQWKTGGASIWVTGNYDPDTNLTFWGTGNGGPWMGDQRPGDNLYTTSTVAIDAATGRIKGHHQYQPNESWDWDEVSPPILVDFRRNGRTIKGLINVARDGYLWFLERTDGRINYIEGTPVRRAERVQKPRSENGTAGRRSSSQARDRQTRGFLPLALGRQELAADRLQPQDADDLHPREREPVRGYRRARDRVHGRLSVHRRHDDALHRPWGRPHRRSSSVERRHGQAGLDAQVLEVAELGSDAGDRRGACLHGRHQRPQVPCVPCRERQVAVGVSDQLRHHRPTVVVHDRRPAIRRRAVGLGDRFARDADTPERAVAGRVSGGSRRGRDLGFRREVGGFRFPCPRAHLRYTGHLNLRGQGRRQGSRRPRS